MQNATPGLLLEQARAQPPIAAITAELASCDGGVYLVGGTIRDLILGRRFVDVDLAVDGDPQALALSIGPASGIETRFGTVSVHRDGHRYDLARTRAETYPQPGALPEVQTAPIDEDLGRRDFTVNAIALGLSGPRAGELLAAPGALDDLEVRRLAVLHDRSFRDDPTRLLRLARYAARLRFGIAPHTRDLAEEAIRGGALDTVSGTRLGNELRLLAGEQDPVAAFEAVAALGLPWALDPDLARRALAVLPADGRADLLVLACALAPEQLDQLGFAAGDRDTIAEAATQAAELARLLTRAASRSGIARAVGAARIETVALASGHGAPSQSRTWLEDLRHLSLDITGDDLIANGIQQGPAIGEALARARDALMDGEATDRESQLRVALEGAE